MSDDRHTNSETGHTPLEREQFCAALSAFRRRGLWVALTLLLVLMLLLWALAIVACKMNEAGVPFDSPRRQFFILSMVPITVLFLWILTKVSQNSHLNCSQCSHPLYSGKVPFYAIVTGRCPNCSSSLFENQHPLNTETIHSPDESLLSRDELLTDYDLARQSALRPALVWVISGLILFVIGKVSAPWLSDVLASQIGDVWIPMVAPALLMPGIIITAWSLSVWARQFRCARACPHCAAPISASDVALITGNCSECGKRAVNDPCPGIESRIDENSKPKWSTSEFHDIAKQHHAHLWIGCLIGGTLATIWLPLSQFMLSSHGDKLDSAWGWTVLIICFGGVGLFQCAGVLLWHWYSVRHIRCPECNKDLLHNYRLVVSSKRCYHCGAKVIESPDGVTVS